MGYLQRIIALGRNANPFFRMMDINVISYGDGEAELAMEVRADMLNGAGWLQGGLYTALMDEAMALALFTLLDDEARIATISDTTSFLRGIKDGRITARGRVLQKGSSIVFTEGCIYKDQDGSVLSRSSASFAILSAREERSSE